MNQPIRAQTVQELQRTVQQKVDLYASVVHASNGSGGQVAAGLKAARVAELDPTADLAQVKVEAGLGQLSVEELVRKLVANGNGNGHGNGSGNGNGGGGNTGVGSAVTVAGGAAAASGRPSPAGSVSGA